MENIFVIKFLKFCSHIWIISSVFFSNLFIVEFFKRNSKNIFLVELFKRITDYNRKVDDIQSFRGQITIKI